MLRQRPLDGPTGFCWAMGNFCIPCQNLPRIIREQSGGEVGFQTKMRLNLYILKKIN